MKKEYSKPQLFYESFSLTGATIASCQVNSTAHLIDECTVNVDPNFDTGWYLFNIAYGACNVEPPKDQLCPYDISGEAYNLFTS